MAPQPPNPCTWDELDAILDSAAQAEPMPAWLHTICDACDVCDLDDAELCEIGAERDERGVEATVAGLLQALSVRHADDRVSLAMLAALQHFHLPALARPRSRT